MLVIIIINTGFLIAALVSLYRVRKDRKLKMKSDKKKKSVQESTMLFRYLNIQKKISTEVLNVSVV